MRGETPPSLALARTGLPIPGRLGLVPEGMAQVPALVSAWEPEWLAPLGVRWAAFVGLEGPDGLHGHGLVAKPGVF